MTPKQIQPSVFFSLTENMDRLILRVGRERHRLIPGGAAEILGPQGEGPFLSPPNTERTGEMVNNPNAGQRPIRKNLSNGLRFDVLKRWQFRCFYCGAKAGDVELHIDHVVPVSKGGTNDFDNLVPACKPCNSGKLAKLLPTTDDDDDCMRVGAYSWPEVVPMASSEPDRELRIARLIAAVEDAHDKAFEQYADLSHLDAAEIVNEYEQGHGLGWAFDRSMISFGDFENKEEYDLLIEASINQTFEAGVPVCQS